MKHSQYALILLSLLPSMANAHTVHNMTMDWFAGFVHPLQGLDHILTMLAVGFWAALLRQRAFWLLPLTFLVVMSLGGMVGGLGVELPNAENCLLMTSAILIAFIMKKSVFSISINALIVGCSAFFHGYAHGVELAESSELLPYSLGFLTSTLLLHGLGIVLMLMLKQRNALAQ